MSLDTRLTRLLGIRYPIIQAGMSWASSCAALPAAVSNGGGLGVIAAGPMRLADLAQTLREMRELTDKPFAVNIPLYRKGADEVLDLLVAERVPVIIASQGSPKAHLQRFKAYGATWLHVVAFVDHARKAAAAGVDGLVVVGSEAGGHPPANEVSTLVNVRRVLQEVDCPLVAGGGVADGHGIAGDDVEHAGGNPSLFRQHRQGKSRQRGFFRRLEDHGATGCQRRADLAGDHRQREIPRRDGRHHTNGFLDHNDARISLMARDHVAIRTLGFFGKPLQKACGIHHFAHGLGQRLALFAAEQSGQVLLVAQHQFAPALEALAALFGGQLAPGRQGAIGRINGQFGFFSASLLHVGDQFTRGRVEHRVSRATAGPLAIDEIAVTDQRAHATASVRVKRSWAGRAERRMRLPAV